MCIFPNYVLQNFFPKKFSKWLIDNLIQFIALYRVRMHASMICSANALPKAMDLINKDDDVKTTVQITQLTKVWLWKMNRKKESSLSKQRSSVVFLKFSDNCHIWNQCEKCIQLQMIQTTKILLLFISNKKELSDYVQIHTGLPIHHPYLGISILWPYMIFISYSKVYLCTIIQKIISHVILTIILFWTEQFIVILPESVTCIAHITLFVIWRGIQLKERGLFYGIPLMLNWEMLLLKMYSNVNISCIYCHHTTDLHHLSCTWYFVSPGIFILILR